MGADGRRPRSCLFSATRQIIHTRMNSSGQQLPSQRQMEAEPKSGKHQMPPTLHLPAQEQATQEQHMLTRRAGGALCICQPMQMMRLQARGCRDKSRPSPWEERRGARRRTTTQSRAVPQLVGRRRPPRLTLARGMRRPGFRGAAPVGSSGHVGSSGSAKWRKNEETNEGRNSWRSSWFQHRHR